MLSSENTSEYWWLHRSSDLDEFVLCDRVTATGSSRSTSSYLLISWHHIRVHDLGTLHFQLSPAWASGCPQSGLPPESRSAPLQHLLLSSPLSSTASGTIFLEFSAKNTGSTALSSEIGSTVRVMSLLIFLLVSLLRGVSVCIEVRYLK